MKKVICVVFACLLLLSVFPLCAFAQGEDSSNISVKPSLSSTSVDFDFEHIFYGEFDVNDFKYDKSKSQIELITMAEQDISDGVEIYIYVYNPTAKTIYDANASIILSHLYSSDGVFESYNKYQLERVASYNSTKDIKGECDATIIKYMVKGFNVPTNSKIRQYSIAEIELKSGKGIENTTIGRSFKYADGEDGIVSVTYGNVGVYELDVENTFYRVSKAKDGYFEDIRSVYFAVDKNLSQKLNSIKASWDELKPQSILFVDDSTVYNDFQKILGKEIPSNFKYSFGAGLNHEGYRSSYLFLPGGYFGTDFEYGFNSSKIPSNFYAGTSSLLNSLKFDNTDLSLYYYRTWLDIKDGFDGEVCSEELKKIYFVYMSDFKNEGLNVDISAEELLSDMDKFDGQIDGEYSDEIIKDIEVNSNIVFEITDNEKINRNNYDFEDLLNPFAYDTLFSIFKGEYKDMDFKNIEMFDIKDYELSNEQISKKYLIDFNDVNDFKSFVKSNADSNIYIFRYAITDAKAYECSMFDDDFIDFEIGISGIRYLTAKCYCCNSSFMETTIIDNFDVIELGLGEDNLGNSIVMPVSMLPKDSITDAGGFDDGITEKYPEEFDFQKPLKELRNTILKIIKIASKILTGLTVVIVVFTVVTVIIILCKRRKEVK